MSEASSTAIVEKAEHTLPAFFGNEIFLVIFNHNVQLDYSSTTSSIVFILESIFRHDEFKAILYFPWHDILNFSSIAELGIWSWESFLLLKTLLPKMKKLLDGALGSLPTNHQLLRAPSILQFVKRILPIVLNIFTSITRSNLCGKMQ